MDTQQYIINHLFEFFTYLTTKSDSVLTVRDSYKAINTEGSSWPNFIFDVNPNKEILEEIGTDIARKKLPKHLILDEHQIDLYEDLLSENNFFPIAEWTCLKLEGSRKKKSKQKTHHQKNNYPNSFN